MRRGRFGWTLGLVAAVWTTTALVHAQGAASADEAIWSGVYTTAQAARGKSVYEAYCTRCHGLDMVGGRQGAGGGPALAGDAFWLTWDRDTLGSLFSKVSKTMPLDSPASLRTDDYSDLVAYILSGNTFPAGRTELPVDQAALERVRIARRAGNETEAPSFALVQTVGCLTAGPSGSWTLARATRPVVTRDEASSDRSLADAASRPLGEQTVRLLGVAPFKPETQAGARVEVRGLLNRADNAVVLDVLSLKTAGARCGS